MAKEYFCISALAVLKHWDYNVVEYVLWILTKFRVAKKQRETKLNPFI